MQKIRLFVLFAALCCVAPMCGPGVTESGGSRGESAQDPADPHAAAPRVRLRLSGQLEGYLEPCGCAANQLGGLARRAFMLRQDRNYDVLIEGGNLIHTATELDVDKLMTILQVLDDSERRYDMLGVGTHDLALPDDNYLYLVDGFRQLTTVASDVVPRKLEIEWPLRTHLERETKDGAKVRVASLSLEAPAGFELLPPAAAWAKAMEGVATETMRVVLLHTTTDRMMTIAPTLEPKPDLIVGINGAFPEPPNAASEIAGIPTVYPGTRGRFLLDVWLARFDGKAKITKYEAHALRGSETAKGATEDRDVTELLLQHRHQVKDAGLRESMAEQLPTPTGESYVGSAACAGCHPSAYKVWSESKHGHAWQTLAVAEGSEKYPWPVTHYPDCVQCHVVGYQQKSGFVNPETTPLLRDVGCEECHGPGGKHVTMPQRGDFLKQDVDICTKCHTYEQTPLFRAEYDKYWKLIEHGLDR